MEKLLIDLIVDFSNAPCDLTRKIATTRAVNFSTVNELNQLGKMDANFDKKWKFDFVVCTSMHQGVRPGGPLPPQILADQKVPPGRGGVPDYHGGVEMFWGVSAPLEILL